MINRRCLIVLLSVLALAGCDDDDLPEWLVGAPKVIKRTPGDRIDVMFNQSKLTPDSAAADLAIDIPEQANLPAWRNINNAMQTTAHVGLTGIHQEQSATIGDGTSFTRFFAPCPVVAGGLVFAMDATGTISAHNESDISDVKWTNSETTLNVSDVLGGGLDVKDDTLYATSGDGNVRAIETKTGKTKWSINVGAPIHGAPAAGSGIVAVLTADNQTIALDPITGQTKWTHRGIHEVASYYTTTAPVISDDIVIAAYSSGEVFALHTDSGGVIWSDTIGSTIKTRASAVFSGIDADPVVNEGVVVVVSAAGEMQASVLKNGRPLWQKRIGSHFTPWSAGNVMYVLSDTHDLAAVLKQDGQIRWSSSLSVADKRDANRDVTPALYGPILAGNAVLVLDHNGILTAFKPQDGKTIGSYELAKDAISVPIIANGAMYYVTSDAKLHRYN